MRAAVRLVALGAAMLAGTSAVPAAGVPPYETHHVYVDSAHVGLRLTTRVRVPTGPVPDGGWPVLWLFHGLGEDHTTWTAPLGGDLNSIAPDLQAVVVMPDARDGWMVDHWDNLLADPAWTRYYTEELLPIVDARFPVSRDRRRRAVGGASMGGLGAAVLAAQRPDQWGTLLTMSAPLDHQRRDMATFVSLSNAHDGGYDGIFGPLDGHWATAHNPARTTANLRATRTLVYVGDGSADPSTFEADRVPASDPASVANKAFLVATGSALEPFERDMAGAFVAAARADGVPVHTEVLPGSHDWPYFRRQLLRAVAAGLFDGPAPPATWTLRTARPAGRAWAFRYQFTSRPPALVTFSWSDGVLRADGSGEVTVAGPGCRFTTTLPFSQRCPVGTLPAAPAH